MMEEITAEFSREQLSPEAPPLQVIPQVTVACKTDLGRVRENNEDKFEYYIPEDEATLAMRGLIFLVCDGMGGHAAGQIASELTCKTFIDVYLHHATTNPVEAARSAILAANRYVLDVGRQVPGRRGMGTTLSGVMLCQSHAIVAQVGDSRTYRLRDGEIEQLSPEHTYVEEQVKLGMMSRREAEQSQYAHVLTRAVGAEDALVPDVEQHDLRTGDIFLLCSDGLTNHVPNHQLAELMLLPPSEAVWRMVNSALQDGGSDNCTAMVVRVDALKSM